MIRYLYGDDVGSIELIDYMGSDARVVNAARVSFAKDAKKELNERDEKLLWYLADHKHTSPFEHCIATFRITVPLFIARQVMRHRTFSYNEVSRRYTSERVRIWHPQGWRGQSEKALQCSEGTITDTVSDQVYLNAIEEAFRAYNTLLKRGISREQARSVLPQSMYTTFYMTGNLHNWAHFLNLRLDKHAQYEIQVLANYISKELVEVFPQAYCSLLSDKANNMLEQLNSSSDEYNNK